MKNILLILFCFFNITLFGQDTNQICIPNNIAREILKDLNELDKLKELQKLNAEEINKLENKINTQDTIILKLEEKDKNSEIIINKTEEKNDLLEEDNKNLRKENKKLKIKNTVIEIFTGIVITTVVVLQFL